MTNKDRIKNMTTDELAEFLLRVNLSYAQPCMLEIVDCKYKNFDGKSCKDCFKEYLESAVVFDKAKR